MIDTRNAYKREEGDFSLVITEVAGPLNSSMDTAPAKHSPVVFYFVFLCLFLLDFVASLTTTSTSTALTFIGDALSLSFADTFWIPASGALTAAIVQPICLTLSSVFGKKTALTTSTFFFTIGSILSGTAHYAPAMITGSSLRGIGVGGIITITDMFVADMVPLHQRGKWMSLLSTSWAFGIAMGPIVGGSLAHAQSWRWIFLMNAPPCLPITAGILLILPTSTSDMKSNRLTFRQIDIPGIIMLTSSTSATLIPCMQAQTSGSWTSWQIYVPIIGGLNVLCGFCAYEIYMAKHPLVPLQIFNNRASMVTLFCAMIHSLTLWSILFFLPFYFENILDFTPLRAGLATLTHSITSAAISILTGNIIARKCRYRWAIWAGWALTVTGYGLLHLLDRKTTAKSWIPINLIPGMGAGMLFISMNIAIQAAVGTEHVKTAITMHTFFRALGSVFGLAVSNAAFQARLQRGLESNLILSELTQSLDLQGNAIAYLGVLSHSARQDTATLAALKEVYVSSLRIIWITIAALAGGALLISMVIPARSLIQTDLDLDEI